METALRPMTLGEILDGTIQIYRRRFLVFAGLAAAPYAAVLVPACIFLLPFGGWPESLTSGKPPDAASLMLMLLGGLLAAPVWIVATALATGALTHAASHRYFGDEITLRGAWNEAWAQKWRYSGLYLSEVLLIWVAPVVVWVLLVSAGAGIAVAARNSILGAAAGLLTGLIAAVLVAGLAAYGVWMLLRLALAFPACVVERTGVGAALRRGPALSSGTKGRIFLLYLLGGIVNYLLTLTILLPMSIAMALIPGLQGAQHARAAAVAMFVAVYGMGIAAQALTKPLYSIALVLFYFDQRIRQEGFDVEWMMMRAGLAVPAPPQPEAQPWTPSARPPEPGEVPPQESET